MSPKECDGCGIFGFLSHLVPSKQEKNIQTETTETKLVVTVYIFFSRFVGKRGDKKPNIPHHGQNLEFMPFKKVLTLSAKKNKVR